MAREVEAAGALARVRLGDVDSCEHDGGGADRQIYQEHPAPAEVGDKDAAQDQAYAAAPRGDRGEDPERSAALLALGGRGGDDAQGGR